MFFPVGRRKVQQAIRVNALADRLTRRAQNIAATQRKPVIDNWSLVTKWVINGLMTA
jgi:hypothetical protein